MKKISFVVLSAVLLAGFHAGAQDAKRTPAVNSRVVANTITKGNSLDMTKTSFTSDFAYKKLDTFTGIVCNAGFTKGKGHGTLFVNFGATNCDAWKSPTVFSTVNNMADGEAFAHSLVGKTVQIKNIFFKIDKFRPVEGRYVAYAAISPMSDEFGIMEGRKFTAITSLRANLVRTDMPVAKSAKETTVEGRGGVGGSQTVTATQRKGIISPEFREKDENKGFIFSIRRFFGF